LKYYVKLDIVPSQNLRIGWSFVF